MRVLVAGCAGFIGFHLSRRYLDDGHAVVGVDSLVTGNERNVRDLEQSPAFRFVRHDISRPLPELGRFDLICNLACPASPVDFSRLRLAILAVCARGTEHLLELARGCGAVFVQASTSEVYGDPREHPQTESYWGNVNPIGPRSCYDEGKRYAEALTVAYRAVHGVQTRIARIFNTYGPRMRADDGRALPAFINQALAGAAVTIHGDGRQTRSFCYVSDLVEGLVRLAASAEPDPVNLGNPQEISILDIAREVVALVGSASPIVHVERPVNDPQLRRPDIARARRILNWEPVVERSEGLRRTVEWFRGLRERG